MHVGTRAGLGDADVAGDARHGRRGAVEQVDLRLGRAGRRARLAAGALWASASSAAASSSTGSAASETGASGGRGGSSCQENWSSRLNGCGTWNQLSIAPVGQGATQSMQWLQVPASTT
jgi:hypothetical protein